MNRSYSTKPSRKTINQWIVTGLVCDFVFSHFLCGGVLGGPGDTSCRDGMGRSLLEHCLRQKTLWQLTEHGVTEQGDAPIYYPSFLCCSQSHRTCTLKCAHTHTHTHRGVNTRRNRSLLHMKPQSIFVSLSHTHTDAHTHKQRARTLDKKGTP